MIERVPDFVDLVRADLVDEVDADLARLDGEGAGADEFDGPRAGEAVFRGFDVIVPFEDHGAVLRQAQTVGFVGLHAHTGEGELVVAVGPVVAGTAFVFVGRRDVDGLCDDGILRGRDRKGGEEGQEEDQSEEQG